MGIATVLLLACQSDGGDWQKYAFEPSRPGATVRLRVVHAVNPRLPRLTEAQMALLLAATQSTVKEHFGVNVEFSEVAETGIADLFAQIPPAVIAERQEQIFDFKGGTGDKAALAAGIHTTLRQRGTTLQDGLAYVRPYLVEVRAPDLEAFSGVLADTLLRRLQSWRNIKAADGAPVLDDQPYNEWIYWETLGYGGMQYELVITNQLIASAEYVGVDIHGAIRGGVTVGTTTYGRHSQLGSFVFWSTFPFTDTSPLTLQQRGGERYSAEEAARLSGQYLAHEIGHQLFQFGHPFGQKSCVMNPVSMLRFREWSRQIDAAACPIGSRAEMTARNIPEYFNRKWLRLADEKR